MANDNQNNNNQNNNQSNNEQVLTDIILKASSYMDNSSFDSALNTIQNGISISPDNYELIFMSALCYEQINEIEAAYYRYRLAIYLSARDTGDSSDDTALIKNELNRMCEYTNADKYKLAVSLEQLILERIHLKEYNSTFYFLKSVLYDVNHTASRIVMTEGNMLLFIMLEICLSEQNTYNLKDNLSDRLIDCSSKFTNIFSRYGCDYTVFHDVYRRIRFILRHIRFGISSDYHKELTDVISQYSVTGEMLAVLVEYCIDPPCWCDTLDKIYKFILSDYPIQAELIRRYSIWIAKQYSGTTQTCMPVECHNNHAAVTYLDYNNRIQQSLEYQEASRYETNCRTYDNSRISIIFCTNDDSYCEECILYLRRLYIPDNMHLDIIAVKNAPGMAAGYNAAMEYSNARYKIYIHHDTFIIDTHILSKLINVFNNNPDVGLIGNSGTTRMTDDGIWWSSDYYFYRINIYQDNLLNVARCTPSHTDGTIDDAAAIDGIFMATCTDIYWCEDLFDNWHFYDISQTYEFRKHGLRTVFLNDTDITLLHELSTKPSPVDYYEKYRQIFLNNYDIRQ